MLVKSKMSGKVEAVLVNSTLNDSLQSAPIESVNVSYAGFEGEDHGGLTRPSCVRVKHQYAIGTEIRNTRQISMLSLEELEQIAKNMGISHVLPDWVGANLVLSGIPHLTLLPPSTRLIFSGGCSMVVDMMNEPCKFPGQIIDQHFPGQGSAFPKAAQHLRGVTGWIEKTGRLTVGESVAVHLPIQPRYPGLPD